VSSIVAKFKVRVDARALGKALAEMPLAVRNKIVRKGLRAWGTRVVKAVRRGVLPADRETRRDVAVKIKSYRRGRVMWAAVGVRKDGMRVGWRSHFWDGGFRVWQKGIKADGTPKREPTRAGRNPNPRFVPFSYRRDWRDGKTKRNLGRRIGRRLYLTRARAQYAPLAEQYVRDAVAEAIRGS
jgi:hypothetical protein